MVFTAETERPARFVLAGILTLVCGLMLACSPLLGWAAAGEGDAPSAIPSPQEADAPTEGTPAPPKDASLSPEVPTAPPTEAVPSPNRPFTPPPAPSPTPATEGPTAGSKGIPFSADSPTHGLGILGPGIRRPEAPIAPAVNPPVETDSSIEKPSLDELMRQFARYEQSSMPFYLKTEEAYRMGSSAPPKVRGQYVWGDGRHHERLIETAQVSPQNWLQNTMFVRDGREDHTERKRSSPAGVRTWYGEVASFRKHDENPQLTYVEASPLLGVYPLRMQEVPSPLLSEFYAADPSRIQLTWGEGIAKLAFHSEKFGYELWLSRKDLWHPVRLRRFRIETKDLFEEWEVTQFSNTSTGPRPRRGTLRYYLHEPRSWTFEPGTPENPGNADSLHLTYKVDFVVTTWVYGEIAKDLFDAPAADPTTLRSLVQDRKGSPLPSTGRERASTNSDPPIVNPNSPGTAAPTEGATIPSKEAALQETLPPSGATNAPVANRTVPDGPFAEKATLDVLMRQFAEYERTYTPFFLATEETYRMGASVPEEIRKQYPFGDGHKHERYVETAQSSPLNWLQNTIYVRDGRHDHADRLLCSPAGLRVLEGAVPVARNADGEIQRPYVTAHPLLGVYPLRMRSSPPLLLSEFYAADPSRIRLSWEEGFAKLTFSQKIDYELWLSPIDQWHPVKLRLTSPKMPNTSEEWEVTEFSATSAGPHPRKGTLRYRLDLKNADPKQFTYAIDFVVKTSAYRQSARPLFEAQAAIADRSSSDPGVVDRSREIGGEGETASDLIAADKGAKPRSLVQNFTATMDVRKDLPQHKLSEAVATLQSAGVRQITLVDGERNRILLRCPATAASITVMTILKEIKKHSDFEVAIASPLFPGPVSGARAENSGTAASPPPGDVGPVSGSPDSNPGNLPTSPGPVDASAAANPSAPKAVGPGEQVQVFSLGHLPAREGAELAERLFGDRIRVTIDDRTNSLIVIGRDLNDLQAILMTLDQPDHRSPVAGQLMGSSVKTLQGPLKPAAFTEKLGSDGVSFTQEAGPRRDAENRVAKLTAAIRKRSLDERDPAQLRDLRTAVRQQFDLRQQQQREELAEFTRRLERIRQSIEARDRIADEIVRRRVEELLDPQLQWDVSDPAVKSPQGPEAGRSADSYGRSGPVSSLRKPAVPSLNLPAAPPPPLGPPSPRSTAVRGRDGLATQTVVQITLQTPDVGQLLWIDGPGDLMKGASGTRINTPLGSQIRLRLGELPGKKEAKVFLTIDVSDGRTFEKSSVVDTLLHNAIPLGITAEDLDRALSGNPVTKVVYRPHDLAQAGTSLFEVVASSRLDPGVDPRAEAEKRGTIVATALFTRSDPKGPWSSEGPRKEVSAGDGRWPELEGTWKRQSLAPDGTASVLTVRGNLMITRRLDGGLLEREYHYDPRTGVLEMTIQDKSPRSIRFQASIVGKRLTLLHEDSGATLLYDREEAPVAPPVTSPPARPAEGEPREKVEAVPDTSRPPESAAEKAVSRLVLVFDRDLARRAVPAVLWNAGGRTLVMTTSPAAVIPDGVGPAIDRAFLEIPGRPPIALTYGDKWTERLSGLYFYESPEVLPGLPEEKPVELKVGDELAAILPGGGPDLRLTPRAVRVRALDRSTDWHIPTRLVSPGLASVHFVGLVEVDRAIPEGTPLFRDGKLAGLTLLGTRFLGDKEEKSYILPASQIETICRRLAARGDDALLPVVPAPEISIEPADVPSSSAPSPTVPPPLTAPAQPPSAAPADAGKGQEPKRERRL